jgi:hypothetical protein
MRLLVALFSSLLLISGCVSVSVNSSNKDSKNKDKISKVFLVAETNGKNNTYYQHVIRHLHLELKNRDVESDTFLLRSQSADSIKMMNDRISKYAPGHVLTVKQQKQENKFEGSHVSDDLTLDVTMRKATTKDQIWQTMITVNSGSVLGIGTVSYGSGGKATAQKIVSLMENEGFVKKAKSK